MADPIGPRITGMQHDVDQIKKALMERNTNTGNTSSGSLFLNINAGSLSLWLAAGICVVVMAFILGASIMGGFWLMREFDRIDKRGGDQEVKIDRANTFLSAIWANAPELEKKVKAEQEKESRRAK